MASDEHASLVEWLNKNRLNFVKDVLVKENYTLDMIVDIADEDMILIFDELNVSGLQRPRFRNAVKLLKKQMIHSTQTHTHRYSRQFF